jgi:hypothetical protein
MTDRLTQAARQLAADAGIPSDMIGAAKDGLAMNTDEFSDTLMRIRGLHLLKPPPAPGDIPKPGAVRHGAAGHRVAPPSCPCPRAT